MELLRSLTTAYGVVLAVTVVAGLVMVAVYLRLISAALGDARAAMAEIVEETGPLAGHLEGLRDASAQWAAQLRAARPRLAEMGRMVEAPTEGRDGGPAIDRATGRARSPRWWRWVSRLFGG